MLVLPSEYYFFYIPHYKFQDANFHCKSLKYLSNLNSCFAVYVSNSMRSVLVIKKTYGAVSVSILLYLLKMFVMMDIYIYSICRATLPQSTPRCHIPCL
jgi:hypothetical protein